MRKNAVALTIVTMGFVLFGAGLAGAKEGDGKDESKGLVDEGCFVIAEGYNKTLKEGLGQKDEAAVIDVTRTMRKIGESHACLFVDVDKYEIRAVTDGEVKPPLATGRVTGGSTGQGPLGDHACELLAGVIDQLNNQADALQASGHYAEAAEALQTAGQVDDAGQNGGCFFVY